MAINLREHRGEDELMVDINTTPLIDVMLVLLIMLIITIPVQTHAVKLDMPRDQKPPIVKPVVVDLAISADGAISWNGGAVPDRAALERDMRNAASASPQPEIHVAADRRTKYSYVAMVLAEAQRSGVVKIGIVANQQYME
jgi:biopolymer transport protein ExbD